MGGFLLKSEQKFESYDMSITRLENVKAFSEIDFSPAQFFFHLQFPVSHTKHHLLPFP